MSRLLQRIDPDIIYAVFSRFRKARWQDASIAVADDDGCDIKLNAEGTRRFNRARDLYRAAKQAAASSNQVFDQAAALASIGPELQKIEAELSPPAFTYDEREVLRDLVLAYAVFECNGVAEVIMSAI